MASTLAARQAANLLRLSTPRSASQAASLIQRRGLAGAAGTIHRTFSLPLRYPSIAPIVYCFLNVPKSTFHFVNFYNCG